MGYNDDFSQYQHLRSLVVEATGLECIRADDVAAYAGDLRAKIHAAIDGAVFVIVNLSRLSPNVFYEYGYAVARNKPVLLIAHADTEVPTNLKGLEIIDYTDSRPGWAAFEQELRRHLRFMADSRISLVRAMLVPDNPDPSYVFIDPKHPGPSSRYPFGLRERGTYGDYLGVAGILGGFASVYGDLLAPEIITSSTWSGQPSEADALRDKPDEPIAWDANLYAIGSFKVNRFTDVLLDAIQGRETLWRFRRHPADEDVEDFEVQLAGRTGDRSFESPSRRDAVPGAGYSDYGLIVRGPHPRFPSRMLMVLAGSHSLGTGAACLAVSKSSLVSEIVGKLSDKVEISTQDRAIWVLVQGKASEDLHLRPEGVTVVAAGVYESGSHRS